MEMPDLTPDMLLRAYEVGVFPMAEDRNDPELFWVDPRVRGIIPLDKFHVPRSLRRTVRRGAFQVTYDQEFEAVIEGCAEATGERPRTWINDNIIDLYCTLHRMGHAHCVECRRDGQLVGGLYGVSLGAAFFGESMFSREPDASKVALVHLAMRLRKGGFLLLDTQFVTEHLRQFGAIELDREHYRSRLAKAITTAAEFPGKIDRDDLESFLRSSAPLEA